MFNAYNIGWNIFWFNYRRRNKKVHQIIAAAGFTFAIVGYFFSGIYFLQTNIYVGLFMLAWGLIILPLQVISYLRTRKIAAFNELFIFIGAMLTNVCLVLVL